MVARCEFYLGEDIITAPMPADNQRLALIQTIKDSGVWTEIVPGMDDITVKFDPENMPGEDAIGQLRIQMERGVTDSHPKGKKLTLPVRFSAKDAPDAAMVCEHLGIATQDLPNWLFARRFTTAMMGFQPGFAYLTDKDEGQLPDIGRLTTPRQHVPAGSIGMLGSRACIYALDGPGGWPIIGRVTTALLNDAAPHDPFVLSPGMELKFEYGGD